MTNWQTKRLGDIGESIIGLTYSPADISSSGLDVLRSSNIKEGRIDLADIVRVTTKIPQRIILKEGDILICARNGSRRLIGKNAYINNDIAGKTFGAFMCVYRTNESPRYVHYIFQTQDYKKQIERDLGPTINQVTTGNLNSFKFAFPEKPEQRRIVAVLEVWDEYLELLDRKIALKEQLKKGLMQQLLTGKKRLPGFTDEWAAITLGAVAKMQSGGTPPSKNQSFYGGNIPWVSIADMTSSKKYIYDSSKRLTEEGLSNSTARMYPAGTVLYAMYASIGECVIAEKSVSSSQAILGIQVSSRLDSEFLYYYLTDLKDRIKLLGQQGTQSNLNAAIVKSFSLNLPTIAEQRSISDALSVSDKEIESLFELRCITLSQKKYLLKNLISGTIRTPDNMHVKGAN